MIPLGSTRRLALGLVFAFAAAGTAALVLAGAGAPAAPVTEAKAAQDRSPSSREREPAEDGLLIYLAKGGPDACGPGCSEWIAVEGRFDRGAGDRLNDLVDGLRGRKLPVFFHSPGGLVDDALSVGRVLRTHKLTVSIGRTVPDSCAETGAESRRCRSVKTTGAALPAKLHWTGGLCASACAYAIMGGTTRLIPPTARLGVHAPRRVTVAEDGRIIPADQTAAEERVAIERHRTTVGRFLRQMGVGENLIEVALRTPHDDMHFLTRDEIVGLAIDSRNLIEVPWSLTDGARGQLVKVFTEVLPGNKSRTVRMQFACFDREQLRLEVTEEAAPGTLAAAQPLKLVAAGQEMPLTPGERSERRRRSNLVVDYRSARAPYAFVDAAARAPVIELAAVNPAAAAPRPIKLSTEGLAASLAVLTQRCPAQTPVATRDLPPRASKDPATEPAGDTTAPARDVERSASLDASDHSPAIGDRPARTSPERPTARSGGEESTSRQRP